MKSYGSKTLVLTFVALCLSSVSLQSAEAGVVEALEALDENLPKPKPKPKLTHPPKWTITAGLIVGAAGGEEASYVATGARFGVRRWLNRYLIATGLVEYNHIRWLTDFDERGVPVEDGEWGSSAHSLAFMARLELARFNPQHTLLAVPDFSLYPVVGAVVVMGDGPGSGVGFRAGLGIQVVAKWPFTIEVSYQRITFDEVIVPGAFFSLGVFAF